MVGGIFEISNVIRKILHKFFNLSPAVLKWLAEFFRALKFGI